MRKIAIVSMMYFWTNIESGPSRIFQIAHTFSDHGYDVEVITSDFQHFKKEKRRVNEIQSKKYPFKITFIQTPKYRKNIDIMRVVSSFFIEKRLKKYLLNNISSYDAVYCTIPQNNVSACVAKICNKYRIPLIVDIEDLWPEGMAILIKNSFIRNIVLRPFYIDAEITYKYASGVIGTSGDYTERAFLHQNRDIPKETVYVGCNLEEFDKGAELYCHEIHKKEHEFWITYAGSISDSYDIKTLIFAAQQLAKEGHDDIKIQILGTGSQKEALEAIAQSNTIDNVTFWGYIEYPKMAAALVESNVVINSFVKGAVQSIVNKVGDYLASGKPMINTLENPEFCKLVDKYGFGINVAPENVDALKTAILELYANKKTRHEMGIRARKLAETEFDRKISYEKIVSLVSDAIESSSVKNSQAIF